MSAGINHDKYHDNHKPDSDSYYNSSNGSASKPSYQDDNENVNKFDNNSDTHSNDSDKLADLVNQRRLPRIVECLRPKGSDTGLDGGAWTHIYPMLSAIMVVKQVGVHMMKEYFEIEVSKSTAQYGFRKVLKLFGDKGYQAAKNELKVNLLRRGCIDILSWKDLTWDIRKQALGYLMLLKRKQSGKMKPQREYITKEESSSPTVSLYTLMSSCLIYTMDVKKVIAVDIPGAFLQGDWPQDEHPGIIMFEGIMVDMICKIGPSYHDKCI